MDFKKTYPGGEPKVEWSDILYMQYSNYYAIQAVAQGIDINTTGVKMWGCEVTYNWDNTVQSLSADMADGYIVLKGQLIKVLGTSVSNTITPAIPGPTSKRIAYLFASPEIGYNTKGDKIFNDGSLRRTWQEIRLKITLKTTNTPDSDETLLAHITVDVNDPEYENVTNYVWGPAETLIRSNEASNEEMRLSRNATKNKIVTPYSLYQSFNDFNIVERSSTSPILETNPEVTRWDFTFDSNVTRVYLLSAYAFDANTGNHIGNTNYMNWPITEESVGWIFDWDDKRAQVYFDRNHGNLALSCYAVFLVKYIS